MKGGAEGEKREKMNRKGKEERRGKKGEVRLVCATRRAHPDRDCRGPDGQGLRPPARFPDWLPGCTGVEYEVPLRQGARFRARFGERVT